MTEGWGRWLERPTYEHETRRGKRVQVARLTGKEPRELDHYTELERFSLFELHRSVNWGRAIHNHQTAAANDEMHIAGALIRNASALEFTEEYFLGSHPPPIVRIGTHTVVLPANAVPVKTKHNQ